MSMLYEELTYKIQGCIFYVHNTLGTGYDEESYHLALEKRLTEENIPFQSKVTKYIEHHEKKIHKFIADLIIDNKIILELKSIQNKFHKAHFLQILSYLKCWHLEVGILVNFGLPKVNFKRVAYTAKLPEVIENYKYIQELINPTNRINLRQTRKSILSIFKTHGVGYEAAIYKKLLTEELTFQYISFNNAIIPIKFRNQILRHFELKAPIINNQIVCIIVALKEETKVEIIQLKDYLKALNLSIGLLIHFGKEHLEITGVSP